MTWGPRVLVHCALACLVVSTALTGCGRERRRGSPDPGTGTDAATDARDASTGLGDAETREPPPCGQTLCGEACVDTFSDSAHCGTCDRACASGTTCQGGACVAVLPGESCEVAQVLPSDVYTEFDLEGYALDHWTVLCIPSGADPDADVAFEWTAPFTGLFELYVSSSRSELVTAGVFGAECSPAGTIACDSGASALFMPFSAAEGEIYRIVVASNVGSPYTGTFTIQVRPN